MSTLSELLPSGGNQNEVGFVASGTLPNGQAVVLKTNGQVEAVAETSVAKPKNIPAGSETVFSGSNGVTFTSVDVNPYTAGQFIISYQDIDNSGYGTAVVGNVSGTTITFQTPVLWRSGAVSRNEIAFDPNTVGKFVIAFKSTSPNAASAIVGTISGNSISFGTQVDIESGGTEAILAFDPHTAGRCAVGWVTSSVNHGKVAVGTVSGTSISFGTSVVYNAAQSGNAQIKFDSLTANRLAVAYYDGGNSSAGTAIIGTLSGTNISFGSEFVFNSGATYFPAIAFSPHQANTFVVAYRDGSDSNRGNARPATVTGTSISYGTEQLFNATGDTNSIHVAFCPNTSNQFIIAYQDELNSNYGTLIEGTLVPGVDTIIFGTEIVFNAAATGRIGLAFDPSLSNAGMFVISYQDTGNSNYGTAILGQIATTAATNVADFIGITSAAITSGASGDIALKGGIAASVANTPLLQVYGPETIWTTNNGYYPAIAYDPNTADKFIIAYVDASDSNKGKVVVGTISGTSVSYGTPYEYYTTATELPSISWDPNTANKFVVVFSDQNTSDGKAVVGTVSGTSISYGTVVDFNGTDSTIYPWIDFDPSTAGSFVICFKDQQNSQYGVAIVGTMSGTSLSFGTKSVFASARSDDSRIAFDPTTANKCVICYKDQPNSSYGTAIVGTVSGTSISFGTEVVFNTGSTNYLSIAFDPNTANKCVIGYTDSGNSSYGTAVLGTVSGTSISFSSEYVYNNGNTTDSVVSFDPSTANRFLIVYKDGSNSSYGTSIIGTVSGTSISFSSEYVYNPTDSGSPSLSFDPNTANKFVVAYQDDDRVAIVGNLSTALTIGSDYYVQSDGTVSTVTTSPAVKAGTAISATTLNLMDQL